MYLSFSYQTVGGTAGTLGNGFYGYKIPSPYTVNTSLITRNVPNGYNNPNGTIVGSGYAWNSWFAPGSIVFILQNSVASSLSSIGLYICGGYNTMHSSGMGGYGGGCYSFQCAIPIN
jgi:hypothetical protein